MSPSLLLLSCVCCMAWSASAYRIEDAELHFEQFIQRFDRQYANDAEKQARFQIFKENLELINEMNMKRDSSIFGITQFMDLTHEEFQNSYTGIKADEYSYHGECSPITDKDVLDVDAPDAFDWRQQNAVTPVKNQHRCGSCYAFSSIGNIESQYAIKYRQMLDLSEQQIVDCDRYNHGCSGGYMSVAFRSLMQQGGSENERDYPYYGQQGTCRFDPRRVNVKLTGCYSYNVTSQERLKQLLVQMGPISIAIRASNIRYFLNEYNNLNSIIPDEVCAGGQIDHAVLLVGYGTENGQPYWIIKNSWGASWGEQGYFRTQRGDTRSSCGMMNQLMASSVVA